MQQIKRAVTASMRFLFSGNQPIVTPLEEIWPEVVRDHDQPRRSARHEVELLLTATSKDGTEYRGYCRDLSIGGTAVLIQGELQVGDEVLLSYQLPQHTDTVRVPAVVRHRNSFRYGFEFCSHSKYRDDIHRLFSVFPDFVSTLRAECALRDRAVLLSN